MCLEESFGALDVDHRRELKVYREHFAEIRDRIARRIEALESLPDDPT